MPRKASQPTLLFFLATHPCVANPAATCQNGGTCNINGADYVCNCTVGWTGRNCETVDSKDPI